MRPTPLFAERSGGSCFQSRLLFHGCFTEMQVVWNLASAPGGQQALPRWWKVHEFAFCRAFARFDVKEQDRAQPIRALPVFQEVPRTRAAVRELP